MTGIQDETLRAAFEAARRLEPTDSEVAQVVARAAASPRSRSRERRHGARRLVPVGAALLVLLTGGYVTAAPVRAAIDDVASTFGGWLGGDAGQAPGRPLSLDEAAPEYLTDPSFAIDPRVIAQAGAYKLFAARDREGHMTFDLGDTGIGLGGYTAESFRDHVVLVLGPGAMENADPRGHVPLFGVTARPVKRVELTYESGPPLRLDGVRGGFVLLAEPARSPRAIVAFDGAGREIARAIVDDSARFGPRIDWKRFGPPAPVIPTRCQPGVVGLDPPPSCPNARPRVSRGR